MTSPESRAGPGADRPLRVAVITETYTPKMGYAENCLSRALSDLGAEVHVLTTTLPPYYYLKDYKTSYDTFLGKDGSIPASEKIDGYTVHRLPYKRVFGRVRVVGLREMLEALEPDVVQTFAAISWIPLDAALLKLRLDYRLFTGSHTTASVFPPAQGSRAWWHPERVRVFLLRTVHGRFVSWFTERCYGATTDCSDVAVRFFGVQPSKITTVPLGVDTDIFSPCRDPAQRDATRVRLGYSPDQIVCIYTGRFSEEKNPLLLAEAVEKLVDAGEPYRALFIGEGVQRDRIETHKGSAVLGFIPFNELAEYYRAGDIGVWPTQESTSMIDAAACGLPTVVNHTLIARERIEGNGITYRLNDVDDLVRALLSLKRPEERQRLGQRGAEKMAAEFSWKAIARARLDDYRAVVAGRSFAT